MRVSFTWENVKRAADAGVLRHLEGRQLGRKQAYGSDGSKGFQHDIGGCIGELALAKYWGVEDQWVAVARGWLPPTDVGEAQVRATPYANGHLLLHPPDLATDPFVLATYDLYRSDRVPLVVLRGWLPAVDGKRDKWWGYLNSEKRECFCVPQEALRPISTLAAPNNLPGRIDPTDDELPDWLR